MLFFSLGTGNQNKILSKKIYTFKRMTNIPDLTVPIDNINKVQFELLSSVVDPNTLNLDPDPGFWPNLDPDPG